MHSHPQQHCYHLSSNLLFKSPHTNTHPPTLMRSLSKVEIAITMRLPHPDPHPHPHPYTHIHPVSDAIRLKCSRINSFQATAMNYCLFRRSFPSIFASPIFFKRFCFAARNKNRTARCEVFLNLF